MGYNVSIVVSPPSFEDAFNVWVLPYAKFGEKSTLQSTDIALFLQALGIEIGYVED